MSDAVLSAVSLVALVITGTLAGWAVFSRHYDDTLVQRVGLSIVAIACAARAYVRLGADQPPPPPPELLLAQIGLATYAVGTAWRVWQRARSAPRERRHPRGRRGAAA